MGEFTGQILKKISPRLRQATSVKSALARLADRSRMEAADLAMLAPPTAEPAVETSGEEPEAATPEIRCHLPVWASNLTWLPMRCTGRG